MRKYLMLSGFDEFIFVANKCFNLNINNRFAIASRFLPFKRVIFTTCVGNAISSALNLLLSIIIDVSLPFVVKTLTSSALLHLSKDIHNFV